MRTCAGCRIKGENENFIRYVEFEGKPLPDVARKLSGKGFNVCPNLRCIRTFVKKNFKSKVSPEDVYQTTLNTLKRYFLNLLSLSHKTGVTVIGQDNIEDINHREGTLILALDLSKKTKRRLIKPSYLVVDDFFTSGELGNALRKGKSIGAVFVEDVGMGRKLESIGKQLVMLFNSEK